MAMIDDRNRMTVVTVGNRPVSLLQLFRRLNSSGLLMSLLDESITDELIAQHATEFALKVEAHELQQKANELRRREVLNSAAEAYSWLRRRCMSISDFEHMLERQLMTEKMFEHVTRDAPHRFPEQTTCHQDRHFSDMADFSRSFHAHIVSTSGCSEGFRFPHYRNKLTPNSLSHSQQGFWSAAGVPDLLQVC